MSGTRAAYMHISSQTSSQLHGVWRCPEKIPSKLIITNAKFHHQGASSWLSGIIQIDLEYEFLRELWYFFYFLKFPLYKPNSKTKTTWRTATNEAILLFLSILWLCIDIKRLGICDHILHVFGHPYTRDLKSPTQCLEVSWKHSSEMPNFTTRGSLSGLVVSYRLL